ncbi:hypothetical protein [Nostoc favosum]|uniref:Transposase n=1 Tax=Nostoc favosum CHAB5714 TaxID=2780399 RepID=A0ABS8IFD2_9NOSO|nr:hypothetical protein [Nostoc favosum]MCC5602907.1 hypothetical protein [Nostoc favosum CHAB5714]
MALLLEGKYQARRQQQGLRLLWDNTGILTNGESKQYKRGKTCVLPRLWKILRGR